MLSEMTPLRAAEILENMAEKDFQSDGAHFEADENIAVNLAASILRRVVSGELVPVVRCGECTLHDKCLVEDNFKFGRLSESRRFCGAGKRKGGASDV